MKSKWNNIQSKLEAYKSIINFVIKTTNYLEDI